MIIKPHFLAVTGSHLYGVSTPDSDLDLRGFVVPSLDSLLPLPSNLNNFEQYEDKEKDIVIYSLLKFFKLLIDGNTQAIETLFSNDIRANSEQGQIVLENRTQFISKRYYRSIRGFASAEYRKARAVKLHINETKPTDYLHLMCSKYNLKRYQRDQIVELIEDFTGQKIKQEYSNTNQVGQSRKLLIDEYGYDIKSAYHCIRLLSQGVELLTEKKITYPRPEKQLLINIRSGKISKSDFEDLYTLHEIELEKANKESNLDKTVDYKKIDNLYKEVINVK